jgi:hypothetical protein
MAMKFRAHDTFFIRKGWLSKGMKYVMQKPDVFVDKEDNPMDVLGIGSNMVKALRYWLQAVGLTEEPNSGKRLQSFTKLGKSIYDNDRFIEEMGTLQLLQYKLATNKDEATAWYYFFNEFNMSEFSRDDFVGSLQNYISLANDGSDVAIRSLNDDFACIMNTYVPRFKTNPKRVSPENNIDCPLGELGLIDISGRDKKLFKKTTPSATSFSPWIILAIIVDQAHGRKEIGLNELLNSSCNIGKIFNLDAITMLDILYQIEKTGELKIIRNAGLDIVRLINEHDSFQDYVDKYYSSIIN